MILSAIGLMTFALVTVVSILPCSRREVTRFLNNALLCFVSLLNCLPAFLCLILIYPSLSFWFILLSFIPKDNPMTANRALISFRDFLPKFFVSSISVSDFWTRSAIVNILAFFRQLAERTDNSNSST